MMPESSFFLRSMSHTTRIFLSNMFERPIPIHRDLFTAVSGVCDTVSVWPFTGSGIGTWPCAAAGAFAIHGPNPLVRVGWFLELLQCWHLCWMAYHGFTYYFHCFQSFSFDFSRRFSPLYLPTSGARQQSCCPCSWGLPSFNMVRRDAFLCKNTGNT